MSRRRGYKRQQEPTQCRCAKPVDTPEWHGKRGRNAGLTGRGGAFHGNPFTHEPGCIHSTLQETTRPTPKKQGVPRLRLQ